MDQERVSLLDSLAAYHRVVSHDNKVVAFIMAMREGVPYYNDNYAWFEKRFKKYLYIDRIVVASTYQKCDIGSRLYRDIIQYARSNHVPYIGCEILCRPYNKASIDFHARHDFKEVARRRVDGGKKQLSIQIVKLI